MKNCFAVVLVALGIFLGFSATHAEEMKIDQPKAFSSAVLMFTEQAPKVGEYLMKAEAMAALVNRKIRP